VEVAPHCPPAIDASLQATVAAAEELGFSASTLKRGLAEARLTGELTENATLATAVLAHRCAQDKPALMPAAQSLFGSAALSQAQDLEKLDELHIGPDWQPEQKLGRDQAETLRRMLLATANDPRLVVARLAIAVVSLRAAKSEAAAERRRQANGARAVLAPLANRLGIWQVKWELEDLAFRYLEPSAYQTIANSLAEKRQGREQYIAALIEEIRAELLKLGVSAEVYGRPKHIFSIYRKMQRKHLAFEQVFDVRALRIICESVPDCYAALGAVHARYEYIAAEFDDYIATPKDNNYRSRHTAIVGPSGKPVEVQIRTREMHEHAELGVAAHWRYKEDATGKRDDSERIVWLRSLLATEPAAASDTEHSDYLDRVRADLMEDRIYAFTPKGEAIELPQRATPLDFAYQVHTNLGHRCRGAKCNGRIVPLKHALQNGDVVEIITAKEPAPSRDWLVEDEGFLVSPRSRAKLRAWFRRLDASSNIVAGRQIIERELQKLGLGSDALSALLGQLKIDNAELLYRLAGEGEISHRQLAQAAQRLQANAAAAQPSRKPRSSKAARNQSPIEVEGVGDLPIAFARCCSPVRPEPIVGYATLGRGLTVHAASCNSLARMRHSQPQRVLRVAWRGDASNTLTIELTIIGADRRGLVRDLSEVVAAENLSLIALSTTTNAKTHTAQTIMRFEIRDQAQLARLLRNLLKVKSVLSARRTA
jgi:GTP pyrophosphokinase